MNELIRLAKGRPYRPQAYEFILQALDYTMRSLPSARHVSGQELAESIRIFGGREFGPMAKHVLNSWGITTTRDFGEIVFDLLAAGHLRKTDEDRLEDFDDCYEFEAAFERDYFERWPARDE